MRDHRESLVGELSKYADVRLSESRDGSLTVSLANGQPLVSGKTAGQLSITLNAAGEQEVALNFAGTSFPLRLADGRVGYTLGGRSGRLLEEQSPRQLKDLARELFPTRIRYTSIDRKSVV